MENRQLRANIRNFMMLATPSELQRELEISNERRDHIRAGFVQELINEKEAENMQTTDIQIPPEFVQFCQKWHGGLSTMLYAIASTGGLTRGTIRPMGEDEPMTGREWTLYLYETLHDELCEILEEHPSDSDREIIVNFRALVLQKIADLQTVYDNLER